MQKSALGIALVLAGCAMPTSFEGEAKFPGGASGCRAKCAADGLEMASFVYVGEFSTACACKPAGASAPAPAPAPASVPAPGASNDSEESAIVAAAAGVEMQRRRIEAQQRAAASNVNK
jgi:hypothetical protein